MIEKTSEAAPGGCETTEHHVYWSRLRLDADAIKVDLRVRDGKSHEALDSSGVLIVRLIGVIRWSV